MKPNSINLCIDNYISTTNNSNKPIVGATNLNIASCVPAAMCSGVFTLVLRLKINPINLRHSFRFRV
jgi:hypothetical protein